MNRQGKGKIGWCDFTVNPVVGCPRGCEYCYACRMNKRFKWTPDFSKPQFFPERLKKLNSKKPKVIFMNSMSDIAYWTVEQANAVLEEVLKNPQHNYIFFTKGDVTYPSGFHTLYSWSNNRGDCLTLPNLWVVKTMTCNADAEWGCYFNTRNIEPILEPINLEMVKYDLYLKQVIIGAETGNRKGKVIPQKEWITAIVAECDKRGVRVFMKDSLIPIVGEENMRRELIWKNA